MQSYQNILYPNSHYVRRSASTAVARRRGLADMPYDDDCSEPPLRKVLPASAAERRATAIAKSPCIEIYPGFEQPLRLSVETEAAIRVGFIRSAECCVCTLEINCIQDARFILCPVCHTITPLDDNIDASSDHLSTESEDTECSFGVGLGFVGGDNRKPAPCPPSPSSSSSSLVEGEEALDLFQ